jgi:nitric oxide dioxygenase
MITEDQVTLVQTSFEHVAPIAEEAGLMFYGRLFELAPHARALFGDDIGPQARRTMGAIATAVAGLDDIARLTPFLMRLGARHAGYGVQPEHFDLAGAALLWTLGRGLGERFTTEVHDAWAAAYGLLADAMLAGMAQATQAVVAA